MAVTYPGRLSGWRFILLNGAAGLANVAVLSNVPGYTILAPYVAGDLQGVTPSFGTWGTTDYMIGLGLGFPIALWLAARYGDYRVYVTSLVAYAVVAFFCATADTIWSFVPARILLGLAGGITLPVGQAVLLGEYPPEKRTLGVGIWGVLSMLPFTVGVFMGGWYNEYLGWRTLFYSDVVIALAVAGMVGSLVYGRRIKRHISRFDGVGYLLLAIILFGIQTIFNQGNDFDWFASPFLAGTLAVVLVALVCFVIWELGERHPAIDLRLFAYRNYAVSVICSFAGFLVIQGQLSVLVGQLQTLLGYSSFLAGLFYLSMIFLSVPMAAIIHELCRKIDVRLIACFNFLGFAATMTWIGQFDKFDSFDQFLLPMIFFGFWLASFFVPLALLALHGLPAARLIRAAEELTLLRTAAGAFGITLLAVVQFRRTPFHQLSLADHFGGRRFASLDLLSQLSDRLQASGFSENMARSHLESLIHQEAALLGLNDAFLLGSLVFLALAAFVWLAQSTIAPTKKSGAARGSRSRRNDGARMIRRILSLVSGVALPLLLDGCAFLPQEAERAEFLDPPPMNSALPRTLSKQTAPPGAGWPDDKWWQQFKSPDLDRVIEIALEENPGLRKAYARLGEAAAVAQVEGARLLPWVDADNTLRTVRYAKHGVVATYNPALGGTYHSSDTFNFASFRYEFDFWGKNRAAFDAALGEAAAQGAEFAEARLLLTTAIVRAYIRGVVLSQQLGLIHDTVKVARGLLDVARTRFQTGLGPADAVLQATLDVEIVAKVEANTRQLVVVQQNLLARLMGQGPDATANFFAGERVSIPARITLPARLPIELLAHRPDLASAMHRAEAAAERIPRKRPQLCSCARLPPSPV